MLTLRIGKFYLYLKRQQVLTQKFGKLKFAKYFKVFRLATTNWKMQLTTAKSLSMLTQ